MNEKLAVSKIFYRHRDLGSVLNKLHNQFERFLMTKTRITLVIVGFMMKILISASVLAFSICDRVSLVSSATLFKVK